MTTKANIKVAMPTFRWSTIDWRSSPFFFNSSNIRLNAHIFKCFTLDRSYRIGQSHEN